MWGKPRVWGLLTRLDHRPELSAIRPSPKAHGTPRATTECWEPGSARQSFRPPRTVPLWVFGLLALGVALLAAAASLPKSETVGLSASLLVGLVGASILLGLTITYAFT